LDDGGRRVRRRHDENETAASETIDAKQDESIPDGLIPAAA
jgi:hypothetical protein